MAVIKLQTSSSFRLATFFTILLVCSVVIILYLISIANDADLANSDIQEIRDTINALGISIIILLFIVLAVAYFVSIYVVNLINTVTDTADDIMRSGDLSQRIPIKHERDDLSKMARVLNTMFDKVEESVEGIRRVSDNIAHDLRTPLARLRTKIEKFDGSGEEKDALIKEADNLINIFNALLRIARIESGKEALSLKEVDMKELISDVVELYEPLAEEKNQELKVSISKGVVMGDRDLLFQTLANLIDNAIKFTPAKGQVEIGAGKSKDRFVIKISDSGSGVTKEDKERVFSRFYRAESSRSTAGHGLGLSLVRAVIDAHQGNIELVDNKPGLEVVIWLL